MIVFRLTKEKYKNELSGKGAAIRGARWNSAGTEIIYAATNRSLAMAEVAVHATLQTLPLNYWILEIQLPEKTKLVTIKEKPQNWNAFPYLKSTQSIGDKLIRENKLLAIKVPSAVVQGEWNVLINPFHKNFSKVKIKSANPFHFDRRLF